MTRCGAFYVELGETPELDRVHRCTRWPCGEHDTQLRWVRDSDVRLHVYAELIERYEEQRQAPVEQGSLL